MPVLRSTVTRRRFIASVATAFAAPHAGRAQVSTREVLYNGITLAAPWPPDDRMLSASPRTPPYLIDRPRVVDIDVGRQLFVDDFLIEESTLTRTFHQATYHPANPVLTPARDWEMRDAYAEVTGTPPSKAAMVFSDGVFFDPADRMFKMWYMGGYQQYTCFARSADGIEWERPMLSIVPRTNIVSPHHRDSSTVWLDLDASNRAERYKLAGYDLKERRLRLQLSADGLHWRDAGTSGPCGDRSTFFYNAFRRKWIFSLRDEADGVGAFRRYYETDTFTRAQWSAGEPVRWARADTLDPRRPEYNVPTTLYNLDAAPYESVLLGLFTIFRGERQEREKPNDICVGFSRDGFHWSRDDRRAFVSVSERQGNWNWSNVQSAGGGCLIVGDLLYFYVSGRSGVAGTNVPGVCSTGLATLRRDGFASLSDRREPGVATRVWPGRPAEVITRPVRFSGRFLFVNAEIDRQLRAEILDQDGKVIPGLSLADCEPLRTSGTRVPVRWRDRASLETLAGTPLRFRFVLEDVRLYAFWVSPTARGESGGYVAAGGPGFTASRDR
jgi:hypothetical protein